MKSLSKIKKYLQAFLLFLIATAAVDAAFLAENNRILLKKQEKTVTFNSESKQTATVFLPENLFNTQAPKKPLITKQEKTVFSSQNNSDAWAKEFTSEVSNWWLEDTGQGKAIITFIKDLSLVQFLRQATADNANNLSQINEYIQKNNYTIQQSYDQPDKIPEQLGGEYMSLIDFWHEYANTFIFILVLITVARLLIPSLHKAITFNKRSTRRRSGSRRGYHHQVSTQEASPSPSISAHGRVIGTSTAAEVEEKDPIDRYKNFSKRKRRRKRSLMRKFLDFITSPT